MKRTFSSHTVQSNSEAWNPQTIIRLDEAVYSLYNGIWGTMQLTVAGTDFWRKTQLKDEGCLPSGSTWTCYRREEVLGMRLWTPQRWLPACCPPTLGASHGTENGSSEEGPALRELWRGSPFCFSGIFQPLWKLRRNTNVLWTSASDPTLGLSCHWVNIKPGEFLIWNPECGLDHPRIW